VVVITYQQIRLFLALCQVGFSAGVEPHECFFAAVNGKKDEALTERLEVNVK